MFLVGVRSVLFGFEKTKPIICYNLEIVGNVSNCYNFMCFLISPHVLLGLKII